MRLAAAKAKRAFPKAAPEQLKALRETLAESPHGVESLAGQFKNKPRQKIEDGLLSLAAVGLAEYDDANGIWYGIG
ncbi:hypothetical protein [Halomonas garicola]|uniref:hypothetical protein n=1 Tax=Halomonas garicola TaxID=1690008 RepID=UPI002897747A|nr:hypothetical protein [Halomonas garicola]